METPLNEIALLANSENRVAVLEMTVDEPRSRRDIIDEVDASRVTITRILREFEERDWIDYSQREFKATPLGEWVYEEFSNLLEVMGTISHLRCPLQWLPTEIVTFDIRHLRDAEITLLDGSDSTAIVRQMVDFQQSGDQIRGITSESAPEAVENQWELTVKEDKKVELVITPGILQMIQSHPQSARRFQEMLATENAQYYVYDDIPISVAIVNDTVKINLTDEEGVLKGDLKTQNDKIREWAVDLFRTYRNKASKVEPDLITA